MREDLIQIAYIAAAVLFILGLKSMSSPRTARRGIIWAGVGMAVATAITFATPDMSNFVWMTLALVIGGAIAYVAARRVAMTDMPQMVAIYNGMGGGAAALIAAVEFMKPETMPTSFAVLGIIGALIGSVSFSGSMIAFAKLQGIIKKSFLFPGQNVFNLLVLAGAVVLAVIVALQHTGNMGGNESLTLIAFFALSLLYGVLMTLPIGGADMPVVISLYNALTGLAVGFEGYVLGNGALIIAGIVVGAAGTLLTQLMAKAMNRSIGNVLFAGFGAKGGQELEAIEGSMKESSPDDAAVTLAFAQKVIIVPGYGMAVAQAQHKVWELAKLLGDRGIQVKFAIHPVAGRMPGHMNVLLAEAGVPYDMIYDLDEINGEFPTADVAIVIGANDVVNPAARDDTGSPIYGMPILDVDKAHPGVRHQARPRRRVRRHREQAVLRGQHAHGVRRRAGRGRQADRRRQEGLTGRSGDSRRCRAAIAGSRVAAGMDAAALELQVSCGTWIAGASDVSPQASSRLANSPLMPAGARCRTATAAGRLERPPRLPARSWRRAPGSGTRAAWSAAGAPAALKSPAIVSAASTRMRNEIAITSLRSMELSSRTTHPLCRCLEHNLARARRRAPHPESGDWRSPPRTSRRVPWRQRIRTP